MSQRASASTPAKSPGKGVGFLNQFTKYFVRPYGGVNALTDELIERRLSSTNCEWFSRPEVAASEMADTMIKCSAEVADNTTLINQTNWNRLNTNNKDVPLTEQHVDTLIHTMTKTTLTLPLTEQLYTTGHAMMGMGIDLRIAQYIISHPHYFAAQSHNSNNHDDKLKKKQSSQHVSQYLHTTLKPTSSQTASSSSTTTARRNLMDLFDSDETLPDLPTSPHDDTNDSAASLSDPRKRTTTQDTYNEGAGASSKKPKRKR